MPGRGESASTTTIVGIALASALVPINSTMLAVALPTLADEFDITTGHAGVLIIVYLVAMLVGQPTAGRLADHIGARRLAIIAVIGFGVFSATAMFATDFAPLVAIRAAQAVFASALSPSVQSLLRKVTDSSRRGRAFGLQGSVIGVGAGLGPVIGGVLLTAFGWRAIFAINLPIVLVVLVVLTRSVPASVDDPVPSAAGQKMSDQTGAATTRLANPTFMAALDDRGWTTGAIGLSVSALTLGMIVMSPIGGRLGDEWGRRRPVVLGLAVATVAVATSAAFGSSATSAVLIATLLAFGLGYGVASPSILTAGIEAAPEQRVGLAAGLLSMSRYVGSILASILLTLVVTDDVGSIGIVLVISTVGLALSIGTASRLPGRSIDPAPVTVGSS